MKNFQKFIQLCNELDIDWCKALDNNNVLQALLDRQPIQTIKTILITELAK